MLDARISVWLDDPTLAKLKRMAAKKGNTLSKEMRDAVVAYCDKEEGNYRKQSEWRKPRIPRPIPR